jgi:cytochrome P450
VHQCIGQALARLELTIVLSKLFERFPTVSLPDPSLGPHEGGIRVRNALVYGIESLPLRW